MEVSLANVSSGMLDVAPLAARNLLTQTGVISDSAAWTPSARTSVSLDPAVLAPDGTLTAWRLNKIVTTDTSNPVVYQIFDVSADGGMRTLSAYARTGTTYNTIELVSDSFDGNDDLNETYFSVRFDIATGAFVPYGDESEYTHYTATDAITVPLDAGVWSYDSVAIGNGWRRFSITFPQAAGYDMTVGASIYILDAAAPINSYGLFWGPQFEAGPMTAYQPR